MKTLSSLAFFAFLLLGTPAQAALMGQSPQGVPGLVTIQLNVPYAFSNVHHELAHAVIRCVAKLGSMSPPIGAGQTTVILNGHPKSGTAIIHVTPAPGQKLSDAKFYICGMQVSNGKLTITPQHGNGPDWAKVQPGSTLMVSGNIK